MSDSILHYIKSHDDLRTACLKIQEHPVCGIDTEFVWDRNYAPELGLVQIFDGVSCYLIDPLFLEDLSPLADLLTNPNVEKIFHAATMDLRVLRDSTGVMPAPIFDSQVAAALLGYGSQTSYSYLVERITGTVISKSETYTNWLVRPLTDRQIEYAASDVTFLIHIRDHLAAELASKGRLEWATDEFASTVQNGETAEIEPRLLYKTVKRSSTLDPRSLAVLRELAEWRDATARQRNIRPHMIIRDETLIEIARRRPSNQAVLKSIRGLDGREVGRSGEIVLKLVKTAEELPEESLPSMAEKARISPTTTAIVDMLWALVQANASSAEIAPELLTSKSELKSLVEKHRCGDEIGSGVLRGWRRRLVGEDIIHLLEGRASLSIKDGEGVSLVMSETPVST